MPTRSLASLKMDMDQPILRMMAMCYLAKNINLDAPTSINDPIPAILKTPVLLGHGDCDEEVRFQIGRQVAKTLTGLGMNVESKSIKALISGIRTRATRSFH